MIHYIDSLIKVLDNVVDTYELRVVRCLMVIEIYVMGVILIWLEYSNIDILSMDGCEEMQNDFRVASSVDPLYRFTYSSHYISVRRAHLRP